MNPQDNLDQRITRALDAAPKVVIPADFAARVAAHAPENSMPQPMSSAFRYAYARGFSLLCVALLSVSLVVLFGSHQAELTSLEILLTSELAVITLVLFLRRPV